jgi:hypothetical protein
MSHADPAEEPDTAVATPPPWSHTLRLAAGWGVAAALCAGIAWSTGAVAARHLLGVRVPDVPTDGEVGAAVELAAIGAGCGLLVGALAGLLLARRRGLEGQMAAAAVVGVTGALAGGLGGGLSVSLMTAFGSLPPELSTGLAWAVAGLLAGLAGGIGRRFWPDPTSELRHAANWPVTGAVGGALACAGGVAAGQLWFKEELWPAELTARLFEMTVYTAGTGAGAGLLAGNIVGLLSRHGRRLFGSRLDSGGRLGLLGALTGLLGGGLAPLLVVGLGPSIPSEVGFGLAGAAAGLFAGLIGHLWTRKPAEPGEELDDEGEPAAGRVTTAARLHPAGVPMLHLLPVLAVAVLTFVAAIATFLPGTRVVLVAVGLLGLAVAYVQAGQERRIRELERRLRQRAADRPSDDTLTITPHDRPSP